MRNGPDSTAVVRALEPENFGNRKLIRPSLNREQARVAEPAAARARAGNGPACVSQSGAHPGRAGRQKSRASRADARGKFLLPETDAEQDADGRGNPRRRALRGIIEWYDKNCIKLNRAGGRVEPAGL